MEYILVVDDEPSILTLLEYNLTQAGYKVDTAEEGNEAYQKIRKNSYDFIILDIMLSGMDGMDICRKVRQDGIETPILMLTAKDQEYDKIVGLELGADDYMTKPFSNREVIARIKAILRRTAGSQASQNKANQDQPNASKEQEETEAEEAVIHDEVIQIGDLEIFTQRYEVLVRGKLVDLTPKEFELLVYLAARKGRILSREQLLNSIWDYDYAGETRIVDVHISHLRDKIEDNTKKPQYIKTVRGFGYKFEEPK
ncbi:response regulator transcription factor [Hutsoniella sourekii]|uniref:response regulator transcription factor n=1 Tax=Hutsoniella sourekii TaxID=87650 RepID=UPI0004807A38|nr:response regulator transcription factor [Hutsoniella sourekii]